MKPKPDHFSLSDWRKAITEHKSPFFTLTQSEVEALVSRLEKAREIIEDWTGHGSGDWLASLERAE